jgi:hypothetical protein
VKHYSCASQNFLDQKLGGRRDKEHSVSLYFAKNFILSYGQGNLSDDNRYVWKKYLFINVGDMKKDCFAKFYCFVDIHRVGERRWNANGLLFIATTVLKAFVKKHCKSGNNKQVFLTTLRWGQKIPPKHCFR